MVILVLFIFLFFLALRFKLINEFEEKNTHTHWRSIRLGISVNRLLDKPFNQEMFPLFARVYLFKLLIYFLCGIFYNRLFSFYTLNYYLIRTVLLFLLMVLAFFNDSFFYFWLSFKFTLLYFLLDRKSQVKSIWDLKREKKRPNVCKSDQSVYLKW